jgi:hypothetical protein
MRNFNFILVLGTMPIHQSKYALKLLTEGASTSSPDKECHKFDALLKKRFSLNCCLAIPL